MSVIIELNMSENAHSSYLGGKSQASMLDGFLMESAIESQVKKAAFHYQAPDYLKTGEF